MTLRVEYTTRTTGVDTTDAETTQVNTPIPDSTASTPLSHDVNESGNHDDNTSKPTESEVIENAG